MVPWDMLIGAFIALFSVVVGAALGSSNKNE